MVILIVGVFQFSGFALIRFMLVWQVASQILVWLIKKAFSFEFVLGFELRLGMIGFRVVL